MATIKPLTVVRGKTLQQVIFWETSPIVRKAITAISIASGAPRLTVTGHGLPALWRIANSRIKGMTKLNAANTPPKDSDYVWSTKIDPNTLELNDIDPVDDSGKEWAPYVSDGFIQFNTPMALTGYTPRVKFKDKVGGVVLASTEIADAPLNTLTVAIDDTAKTITLTMSAIATAAILKNAGVWEVEAVNGAIVKSVVPVSPVTFVSEVVT